MTNNSEWVTARKATQILGIEKKTLFKYRDDGTLRLGPHYLAFENCFSRDDYKYNIEKVKEDTDRRKIFFLLSSLIHLQLKNSIQIKSPVKTLGYFYAI